MQMKAEYAEVGNGGTPFRDSSVPEPSKRSGINTAWFRAQDDPLLGWPRQGVRTIAYTLKITRIARLL